MQVIREATARFMSENFGISAATTEVMFDTGLFREDLARRVLIRDEYNQEARPGNKTDIKWQLSDKYAVSESTVEKYLSKNWNCKGE